MSVMPSQRLPTKAYIVKCYCHHCLASHAVSHQSNFLVTQVSDEFGDILGHDMVVHLFRVRTVTMVSRISTNNLFKQSSSFVNQCDCIHKEKSNKLNQS